MDIGLFPYLAVMNDADVKIVSTCFHFSRIYIAVSMIARSHANSVFNFLAVISLKLIFVCDRVKSLSSFFFSYGYPIVPA